MKFAASSASLLLLMAAAAWAAESGSGKALPKQSPFLPPAGANAAAAPVETIEFAGVSMVGQKADLVFYDKTAKKSHWIPEGETKEGIAVLRYDARRQQVVVKVNGVEKTLPLRKGTGPLNAPGSVQPLPTGFNVAPVNPGAPSPTPVIAPAAAPAVVATAPAATMPAAPTIPKPETPETPAAQAKAETEARMLVSDLLEIGMAQRKAYEEAQRKAAEGNAQPTAQNPSATTTPGGTQPPKPNGN